MKKKQIKKDDLLDRILSEERQNKFAYLIDGPFHGTTLELDSIDDIVRVLYVRNGFAHFADYSCVRVLGLFAWEFEFQQSTEQ